MNSRQKSRKPPFADGWIPLGQRERLKSLISAGLIKSTDDVPPGAIFVNHSRVHSRSVMPAFPLWYADKNFTCRDCGKQEIWTARQQQWWDEVAKGEIETFAIRCRTCRRRKREADETTTRCIRQSRLRRAHERAAKLYRELAAGGSAAFAVLDAPVTDLDLAKRMQTALEAKGVKTIGELVAMDTSLKLSEYGDEWGHLKRKLKDIGLFIAGAAVPRL